MLAIEKLKSSHQIALLKIEDLFAMYKILDVDDEEEVSEPIE